MAEWIREERHDLVRWQTALARDLNRLRRGIVRAHNLGGSPEVSTGIYNDQRRRPASESIANVPVCYKKLIGGLSVIDEGKPLIAADHRLNGGSVVHPQLLGAAEQRASAE